MAQSAAAVPVSVSVLEPVSLVALVAPEALEAELVLALLSEPQPASATAPTAAKAAIRALW